MRFGLVPAVILAAACQGVGGTSPVTGEVDGANVGVLAARASTSDG